MTVVPRPVTKLTAEQQELLSRAVTVAKQSFTAAQRARDAAEDAWQAILAARTAGVPDEQICDETGFSRATLNRRYGRRSDGPAAAEGEPPTG